MPLPSPSQLLGAGQFNDWYPGQYDLLEKTLDWYESPARFLGLSVATGSGKSLSSLLLSKMTGGRTIILTATKGLQAQYLKDCAAIGGVGVMGQNNFPCPLVNGLTADDGPCHDGAPCSLKEQCPYRVQLRAALNSNLVVTNYAYWLAQTNFSQGLGDVDLLIADEGHSAFGFLEGYLTLFLSRLDLQPLGIGFPTDTSQWSSWRTWASLSEPIADESLNRLEMEIKQLRSTNSLVPGNVSRAYRSTKAITAKLERLSTVTEDWVIQKTYHGFRFIPKWVSQYTNHLFPKIPKIMIMSAILSHRSLDYLGVPSNGDRAWIEMPSQFPAENTPVWHIPTTRVNYRTDDYGTTLWVSRIDQIIQRRLDRKGIIFTVSYDRARMLISRSRFKEIMLTHDTRDVVEVIEKFKRTDAPAVLVSPSVTTGYDFPGEGKPQYIIMGKIAYPDSRDPVTKARHEEDKDWTSYLAMDTMVQSAGRMTRCLSWDTQVLTEEGWKGPEEVSTADKVYSLSPHNFGGGSTRVGGLELTPVRAVPVWDTDDKMVQVVGKSLDICVTPDHELVVLPYNESRRVEYRYRKDKASRPKTKNPGIRQHGLTKCQAKNLPVRFKVLVSGHVQRERSTGSLIRPRIGDRDKWYFLMGLIISDGWISKTKNRIRIAQSTAKPDVCQQIEETLEALGIAVAKSVSPVRGTKMRIGANGAEYTRNGDLIAWDISGYDGVRVRRLFLGTPQVRRRTTRRFTPFYPKDVEKTIPMWMLKQCRKRELRALLRGLMAGDGTWSGPFSGAYYTSDPVLADRVQYLLTLADCRSHLRVRRGNSYEIQFSDTQFAEITRDNVSVVSYSGKTWCVSTDLGTIVTRRNGYVAIVGNSVEDKTEVLIVDDNWVWFWPKYKHFAPKWFHSRVRGSLPSVPDPLV